MKITDIKTIFFSPTGGTEKAARALSEKLSEDLSVPIEYTDITPISNRQSVYSFSENTLVILASPVYAGRMPNKLLPDLQNCIKGSGNTPIITVSVYGNRNYDEALREMLLLSENNGFIPMGASAVVSQHAFSDTLAKGRPDDSDIQKIYEFSDRIAEKIINSDAPTAIEFDRDTPVKPYYTPLKTDLTPARFLKAKPLTDINTCTKCGICVEKCPMGSIDASDVTVISGVCIKCQACVKLCPTHSKYFTDEDFLSHVKMLESNYTDRKEPVFFI